MGAASGYLAALVFSLYVEYGPPASLPRARAALAGRAGAALLGEPLWILAGRGQMQDDPVKFALRDRTAWCAARSSLGRRARPLHA